MSVVYLTNDLMFSSRVTGMARTMGVTVTVVRTQAAVFEQVLAAHPSLLFVDLEHPEADIAALVAELASAEPRPRVVAYGPHVKESLLAAAQQAGCDLVLSRGQFDKQFSSLLAEITPA